MNKLIIQNNLTLLYFYYNLADPYVKITLCYKGKSVQKGKSSVKKDTLSPVYNEHFVFKTIDMDTNELHLNITVKDYDRFSWDDRVGEVQIGADISDAQGLHHWKEVMRKPNVTISCWHRINS